MDAEKFVEGALAEFLRERAGGKEPEVEEFVRARAGGDAERAELLRTAIRGALAGEQATMPLPAAEAAPAPGAARRIDGRYLVERELGEGGFGVVYLVRDELYGGARRALKTLRKELTQDPGVAQRFRNEMVVVKALNHPLLPRFHNDGRTPEGEFYYVMDFVEGEGLDKLLRREGPLQPDRIVRLVRQLLEVLAYAHGKGVFHRDLKPANILLVKAGTDEEEVRVLDFGIAKILTRGGDFADLESLHTMEGGAIGTPHYMAPEQVTGQGKVDEKTDLYALGIIVYQMCSGRVPFTGKTSMEIAAARLTQAPPPLDEDTPAWLRVLVMSLLERQQAKRPSTQEIRVSLDELASGQRRMRRSLGFVGAGVVAVALGVAYMLYESERAPARVEPTSAEQPVLQRPATAGAPVQLQRPADGLRTSSPDVEVVAHAPGRRAVRIGEREVLVDADGYARTSVRVATDAPAAIVVRAEDGLELARSSVFVDTTPPKLRVELPEGVLDVGGRWTTSVAVLAISGSVDDGELGALPAQPIEIPGAESIEIDEGGAFRALVPLAEGLHTLEVRARDLVGLSETFTRPVLVDRSEPRIELDPTPATTEADRVRIEGRIEDATRISALARGPGAQAPIELTLDASGRFSRELPLELGRNEIVVQARDLLGHDASTTFVVERTAAAARIVSVEPPSGRSYSAAETTAMVAARTSLAVSRVEATRGGARVEVGFSADDEGFRVELPLAFGANQFRLVPYDQRDVAGEALPLTYVRESPAVPPGCALPQDVELDAEGRPLRVIHERSGLTLVLVPGGARGGGEVEPFYVGRTEVTIGELLRWRSGFYDAPESRPAHWNDIAAGRERHPATKVSFDQAQELCRELGLRLPRAEEWELAAGGAEGRAFPWGDEPRPLACNANDPDDGFPRTAPVGSFPLDLSPCGALDMAGNVSEWCTQGADARPALRGGNWYSEPEQCQVGLARNPPSGSSDTIGFRVALDAPSSAR